MMRRLRTDSLSDDDIALLNTRVGQLPITSTLPRPFRPIAVSTNALRSAINLHSILSIARNTSSQIFECIAEPSTRSRTRFAKVCNLDDTLTGRIPLKLLYYFGMPVMICKNSADPELASVLANGTTGHIVGHDLGQACVTPKNFDGVDIFSLSRVPDAIHIKLLNSSVSYDNNLPPGVIALPPFRGMIDITIPNAAKRSISMTIKQFQVVPAFALTPEILQGQTCTEGLTIMDLRRDRGTSRQVLYVAFSRSVSLDKPTLTRSLDRSYLRLFSPRREKIAESHRLINLVSLPTYTTQAQVRDFQLWRSEQLAPR
jgi:hypothetical protein